LSLFRHIYSVLYTGKPGAPALLLLQSGGSSYDRRSAFD
jgi:hypothetical protein